MTRCPHRDVRHVLEIDQVSAHVLVTPGWITSQVCDIVPLVVRRPREVHGIDLRATSQSGTTRVEDTEPAQVSSQQICDGENEDRLRFCTTWWIKPDVVRPICLSVGVLGISPGLCLILIVFDKELPRMRRILCTSCVPSCTSVIRI